MNVNKCWIIAALIVVSGCSTQGGVVKSLTPLKVYIDVQGHIDEGFNYKMAVEYRSTVESRQCTDYSIALGKRIAQTAFFSYTPELEGNSHYIRVPLHELESNTSCGWEPIAAHLCLTNQEQKDGLCTSLYSFHGEHTVGPRLVYECSKSNVCFESSTNSSGTYINKFNEVYHLDILAK